MTRALVQWISGPVLRARPQGAFALREAVRVGARNLLGEVIRVQRDEIVVQVYEDTTGLRPGTEVHGCGGPLSVRLGPAVLGGIFDGLLRPISGVTEGGPWVQPGGEERKVKRFPFEPVVTNGDRLPPGGVLGIVKPRSGTQQYTLVPPNIGGVVEALVGEGEYGDNEVLCRITDARGNAHPVTMGHQWPVRRPRPVAQRLPSDELLLTGQRVVDCLFPVARGGKAAIPGGFGTGKTVFLETLAKWCNADVIVYVGCGERGNEMAGLLEDFIRLEDPRTGRLLAERTVIIANTSNMPVAAREASIYTGVTVAEYFRDQGFHVAVMADSTSRWAEALREVSGRVGELPGEGGYPAYLSSRLADFYERAALVKTLAGPIGSVTLMGAVSPPSSDFSEPVTSHTKRYIRSLWALDAQRAYARFYPAIHPLQSYSLDAEGLARWWHAAGCVRWQELRTRFLTILEAQTHLERMARIIGKDAMPVRQRYTLLCADLINEGFLRQFAFSPVDRFASPSRQAVMMRLIGQFLDASQKAIDQGATPETIQALPVFRRLMRMGEEIGEGEWERFSDLSRDLDQALAEFAGGEGVTS
ncbi:MAG: V-type ATP synthase subunit A [Gammaproteobacteria bacterium]